MSQKILQSSCSNTPSIRFPGFSGDWESKRLGELCSTLKSGKGITSRDIRHEGTYPVFGGNGLRGYAESYTHDGNYVLIGRQGALCGNINRTHGKVYISEHAVVVDSNSQSDIDWLAHKLEAMKLNRYSESSAQPGLSVEKLSRMKLVCPKREEQQKIALFLSSVDTWLDNLRSQKSSLESYKKSIMQMILLQKVRFKNDDGYDYPDWTTSTLSRLFSRIKQRNNVANTNVLTISAQQGLVNQETFFTKSVSSKNLTNYYLLQKDDFAYNKSYSKGYPVGAIKRLTKYDNGVVSPLYICFRAKQSAYSSYFDLYFDSGLHNKEVGQIVQEGARNHGLINISVEDFFEKVSIAIPCEEEMQKITKFAAIIEKSINTKEYEIAHAVKWKNALIQRMFV